MNVFYYAVGSLFALLAGVTALDETSYAASVFFGLTSLPWFIKAATQGEEGK